MLVIAIFLGVGLGCLAFMYWSFPFNIGSVILAVAAVSVLGYFVAKAEKRARFEAFYAAIQNFGTPLYFDNVSAAFERDGTRFEINYPKSENDPALKINFYLPGKHQRFNIQHQSVFLKSLPDCPFLQNSPLSPDVHLYTQNPTFLARFVQLPAIRDEIYEYPSSFFSRFQISFDAGSFDLQWIAKSSQQAEGVYKICKTAVVFHDELKKIW